MPACCRSRWKDTVTRQFTLDPREIEAFVATLPPRCEVVYRVAFRGLSEHCRGDHQFKQRTDALLLQFIHDLDSLLPEAEQLKRALTAR